MVKEERVETVDRTPVLKCSHTSEEKCHFTYLTIFSPTQVAVDTGTVSSYLVPRKRSVTRHLRRNARSASVQKRAVTR